jgi:SnoaL-like domain
MDTGRALIDRFYELLAEGDVDGVVALYAAGAQVIRFDAVAATPDEIKAYIEGFLRRHRACSLHSIDQFRESDDIVMWDAMLDTADGVLQATHVVVLDADGAIRRHIPNIRGYWGK